MSDGCDGYDQSGIFGSPEQDDIFREVGEERARLPTMRRFDEYGRWIKNYVSAHEYDGGEYAFRRDMIRVAALAVAAVEAVDRQAKEVKP